MCLHAAKKIEQEGEVKCYKILIKDFWGMMCSPYYFGAKWTMGVTKTDGAVEPFVDSENSLHSGAFHTFATIEDANLFRKGCIIGDVMLGSISLQG